MLNLRIPNLVESYIFFAGARSFSLDVVQMDFCCQWFE